MKLSILGRTLVLPEDVTVTIVRDARSQPVVIIEDGDCGSVGTADEGFEPMTLMDIFNARNTLLDDIPMTPTECGCDDCAEERAWRAAQEQAIHDTRMAFLSEIGNMLSDEDLLKMARARESGQNLNVSLEVSASQEY
jgi:hypothetical protein